LEHSAAPVEFKLKKKPGYKNFANFSTFLHQNLGESAEN
jgi:hypothetical protein